MQNCVLKISYNSWRAILADSSLDFCRPESRSDEFARSLKPDFSKKIISFTKNRRLDEKLEQKTFQKLEIFLHDSISLKSEDSEQSRRSWIVAVSWS